MAPAGVGDLRRRSFWHWPATSARATTADEADRTGGDASEGIAAEYRRPVRRSHLHPARRDWSIGQADRSRTAARFALRREHPLRSLRAAADDLLLRLRTGLHHLVHGGMDHRPHERAESGAGGHDWPRVGRGVGGCDWSADDATALRRSGRCSITGAADCGPKRASGSMTIIAPG